MYSPKFTITNEILKNIGTIEACREVIENAPLIPAYEKRFRQQALARTVHHGTHIEGNDLSLEQAKRVIEKAGGETDAFHVSEKVGVVARERDVQEIINYRRVIDWLDKQQSVNKKVKPFRYTEDQVRTIHKLVVNRLIPQENQGVYRKSQVVLRDSATGEVTFRPPPAIEAPYLMEDFIAWLDSKEGRSTHPVIRSSIAHYQLAAIHPFVDGNGRTARAFATLVLFVEGYDIRRLFSLEEYFDQDAGEYFKTLVTTTGQGGIAQRDLSLWIEYFTKGLAIELSRVKETVRKVSIDSKIRKRRGRQVALSERQMKVVELLAENPRIAMFQLREVFSMVSEDTVLRDLKEMIKKGIIRKRGRTKGAYYELVT